MPRRNAKNTKYYEMSSVSKNAVKKSKLRFQKRYINLIKSVIGVTNARGTHVNVLTTTLMIFEDLGFFDSSFIKIIDYNENLFYLHS